MSTDKNYNGLSYGDLVAIRANWLFSESPDYQYQSDILHLHGNMRYSIGQAGAQDDFYDRRGDLEERITTDTAIFVPVMSATYVMGDKYEGLTLDDEVQLRRAARTDIRLGGGLWATIQPDPKNKPKQQPTNPTPIMKGDIKKYMIESPLIKLKVSERNPFLPHLEVPLEPGEHDAVVVGYFLLIEGLPVGRYRIQFGGKGRGDYRTDAVYDILVDGDKPINTTQDFSSEKTTAFGGRIPSHSQKNFNS
jgi:hypothetical protein